MTDDLGFCINKVYLWDLLFLYVLIQTGGHFGGPEVYVVTWVGEGRIAFTQAQGRRLRIMDKCL